jgi:hypothetical protein
MAGKYGNFCINCFKKLSRDEKDNVGKHASKLKFWAKSGYYVFIAFLAITIGSLALVFISYLFLFLGLVFVVISFVYGVLLFRFLNQKKQ